MSSLGSVQCLAPKISSTLALLASNNRAVRPGPPKVLIGHNTAAWPAELCRQQSPLMRSYLLQGLSLKPMNFDDVGPHGPGDRNDGTENEAVVAEWAPKVEIKCVTNSAAQGCVLGDGLRKDVRKCINDIDCFRFYSHSHDCTSIFVPLLIFHLIGVFPSQPQVESCFIGCGSSTQQLPVTSTGHTLK